MDRSSKTEAYLHNHALKNFTLHECYPSRCYTVISMLLDGTVLLNFLHLTHTVKDLSCNMGFNSLYPIWICLCLPEFIQFTWLTLTGFIIQVTANWQRHIHLYSATNRILQLQWCFRITDTAGIQRPNSHTQP